ncbi:MAG: response regulator transcription factor [Bacteroidia bacterium]|nr:response regulator transcription factor [Bacteroidia bacterium]
MYRIGVVEDHAQWRQALTQALCTEEEYQLRAFGDLETFLEAFRIAPDDLVIMDIHLPGASGIDGVRGIKALAPETDVIMCTAFEDDQNVFASLKAGACGYLLKRSSLDEILAAVAQVRSGGAPMTPSVARRVLASLHRPSLRVPATELTGREQEILDLLGEGKAYKDIAAQLCVALSTVQTHVKSIYRKLHITCRAEIAGRSR